MVLTSFPRLHVCPFYLKYYSISFVPRLSLMDVCFYLNWISNYSHFLFPGISSIFLPDFNFCPTSFDPPSRLSFSSVSLTWTPNWWISLPSHFYFHPVSCFAPTSWLSFLTWFPEPVLISCPLMSFGWSWIYLNSPSSHLS